MAIEVKTAKAIFLDAIHNVPVDQWSSYVEQACDGDANVAGQVQRLLKAHLSDKVLVTEAVEAVAANITSPSAASIGTLIGPYKILEQIGEGGMGVVYVAEQTEPVRRRVALKIIKPGMDTKQVVARFEAERQALAMMDHPNIARVLDAGTTDVGRPFFVMELVRGLPITDYCDKARLSPRHRLELFITVCQAVQHAHQKGIIHRDLKPSNVLVTMHDGRPMAKVIDFGVAKAIGQQLTDRTIYTAHTQLVGTPLYMSPEQAELSSQDVDTRSDVYSLGVLLYELLTGQTPFDKDTLSKAGFDEMRRIIREDEPPPPSHRVSTLNAQAITTVSQQRSLDERNLGRVLRGELDWIVMTSLEKDRNRRYESPSAFAADIERYLGNEPVLACPPSLVYRLKKLAIRRRAVLTTSAFVAVTLMVAIVTLIASHVRVLEQRDIARTALEEKNDALAKESAALQRARQQEQNAREAAYAEKAARENEAMQRKLAEDAGADTKAFADFLVKYVLAAPAPKGLSNGKGVNITLEAALKRAEPSLPKVFEGRPTAEATTRRALGITWLNLGQYATAEQHLRRAHQPNTELFGPDNAETVETARFLADCLNHAGKNKEALELLRELADRAKRSLGLSHEITLAVLNSLASALQGAGQLAEAVTIQKEVLAEITKPGRPETSHSDAARNTLANLYLQLDQTEDAVRLLEQVLKNTTAKAGAEHPLTLWTMNNLGAAYLDLSRTDEAVDLLERALTSEQKVLGRSHPTTLTAMNNLGSASGPAATKWLW